MDTFIQQVCIILIERDSKDFNNVAEDFISDKRFYFELLIEESL